MSEYDAKKAVVTEDETGEGFKIFGTLNGETMERFYTVSEAAILMHVKPGWVYTLIGEGKLKSVLLPPRSRKIPESAIREYITEHPTPGRLAAKKVPRAIARAKAKQRVEARKNAKSQQALNFNGAEKGTLIIAR